MYISENAINELGAAPANTAAAPSGTGLRDLAAALARGAWPLAIRIAGLFGNRDENHLSSMIFYARHPERGKAPIRREEPRFRELSREWLEIRDTIVRPALRRFAVPSPAPRKPSGGVDPDVVARIDRHFESIDRISRELGMDANIVRGIIAAESGGKANLVTESSRYTGLMQAGREPSHKDPEVSIRAGIRTFKEKLGSIRKLIAPLGIDLGTVDRETLVRWVMTGYNAGQLTVAKAVEFAARAGDYRSWFDAEHFSNALLYTGAYAVPLSCIGKTADDIAVTLSQIERKPLTALRVAYASGGKWDFEKLKTRVRQHLRAEIKGFSAKLKAKQLTLRQARELASPWATCAREFKHAHIPGYLDKIIRYMRYYDSRGAGGTP